MNVSTTHMTCYAKQRHTPLKKQYSVEKGYQILSVYNDLSSMMSVRGYVTIAAFFLLGIILC